MVAVVVDVADDPWSLSLLLSAVVAQLVRSLGLINWRNRAARLGNRCRKGGRLMAIATMVTPEGAHGYSWSISNILESTMLPYYMQPKQYAAEANCKKTVRILFPNFSILFNSYS